MKKSNLIALFSILNLMLVSCSNDNAQDNNQNDIEVANLTDEEKIDNLFGNIDTAISNKLTTLNKSAEKSKSDYEVAITFLVIRDNKSGNITLANFETQEVFPLPKSLFSRDTEEGRYIVECSGGSEGDWTSSCNGKVSCGLKISRCLDEGGCASICEVKSVRLNANDFLGIDKIEKADLNFEDLSAVQIGITN